MSSSNTLGGCIQQNETPTKTNEKMEYKKEVKKDNFVLISKRERTMITLA